MKPTWTLAILALMACNGAGEDPASDTDVLAGEADAVVDADADADVDADTDSDTDADGPFDNDSIVDCDTNIDADVPAFYKTYFRCVDIWMDGGDVVIWSDGAPPHESAYYQNGALSVPWDNQGGSHFQNPNWIAAQDIEMTIPSNPVAKGITIDNALVDITAMTSNEEYSLGTIGVALNGVSEFNAAAAPGMDLYDEQWSFDLYEGHPQNTGVYHYHGRTPGPLEVLWDAGLVSSTEPGQAEVELYGILCDGTLVLGCTELDGSTPSDGDFDAQNGHVHDIADATMTHFTDRYHTHVCPAAYANHPFNPEIAYYDGGGCPRGGPGGGPGGP